MIDEVFRTEWSRLVATLVRDLRDLDLAEEAAQEAFVEAAARWPGDGLPERPGAWLLTTARRRAIDRIRRSDNHDKKLAIVEASARSAGQGTVATTLGDDQLALLLGCCHPALNTEAQTALTLRVVAGLTTAQIARAFLISEPTMSKRLTRAKNKIRQANIAFRPPDRDTLDQRLGAVLQVIYLVFTEGHASSDNAELVRGDLCDEAIWLSDLLLELLPEESAVYELAALLRLTDARRSSRVDAEGLLVLLEDQDRSRWDRRQLDQGLALLRRAHVLGEIGLYGLQAAVQAVHVSAASFDETDWLAIVEIYDRMLTMTDNPVIRLNRAAAISWAQGPAAGLAETDQITSAGELADYHYLHSARADMLRRIGDLAGAADAYHHALDRCANGAEHDYLTRRLAALTTG